MDEYNPASAPNRKVWRLNGYLLGPGSAFPRKLSTHAGGAASFPSSKTLPHGRNGAGSSAALPAPGTDCHLLHSLHLKPNAAFHTSVDAALSRPTSAFAPCSAGGMPPT